MTFTLFSLAFISALVTKDIEYKEGDTVLQGYLAYDDTWKAGEKPGVVIVHEWKGLGDYAKRRAKEMAALGYVAFAADIYGKGVRPKTTEAAAKESSKYKANRALLRARATAAVNELKRQNLADAKRLGAMGYCFGGTTVLELARAKNPDVKAVVSFHGGLETPSPAQDPLIADILVLHGADDPYVPAHEVENFKNEMKNAKAKMEFVAYPGAVHSFTDPAAGNDNSKGAAYNKKADEASFAQMKDFFAHALK